MDQFDKKFAITLSLTLMSFGITISLFALNILGFVSKFVAWVYLLVGSVLGVVGLVFLCKFSKNEKNVATQSVGKKINKRFLIKTIFFIAGSLYLMSNLIAPWLNSIIDSALQLKGIPAWESYFVTLPFLFLIFLIMRAFNHFAPNSKVFKKDVFDEFLSFHNTWKASIIYIISVAFLSSTNQVLGIALIVPYYLYVINFFTSVSSGKIKGTWI